jgi:hypothetical protein
MKPYIDTIRRTFFIALLALFTVATVGGCKSGPLSTITQANLDKIQNDMSSADVKAILGDPTESATDPIPIVGGTKTTYTYTDNQNRIVIVLKNDKVQTKEGTFPPAQ